MPVTGVGMILVMAPMLCVGLLSFLGFSPCNAVLEYLFEMLTAFSLGFAIVALTAANQWAPQPLPPWVPAWIHRLPLSGTVLASGPPMDKSTEFRERLEVSDSSLLAKKVGKRCGEVLNQARPLLVCIPGLSVWDMDLLDFPYMAISAILLSELVLVVLSIVHWYLLLPVLVALVANWLVAVADIEEQKNAYSSRCLPNAVYFDSRVPCAKPHFGPPPAAKVAYRINDGARFCISRGLKALAIVDGAYDAWRSETGNDESTPLSSDTVKMVSTDTKTGRRKIAALVPLVIYAVALLAAATAQLFGAPALRHGLIRAVVLCACAYGSFTQVYPRAQLVELITKMLYTRTIADSQDLGPAPELAAGSCETEQFPSTEVMSPTRQRTRSEPDAAELDEVRKQLSDETLEKSKRDICFIDESALSYSEAEDKIGSGGMGSVFRAKWELRNGPVKVAIKKLHTNNAKPGAAKIMVDELKREALTLSKLGFHTNIVQFYGMGSDPNKPCFVTEFVDGETLLDLLYDIETFMPSDRLAPVDKCHIAVGVADGLQHIHDSGLVHLDLKPANVMVHKDGQVPKLIDVGISRAAEALGSTTKGTWFYMGPEQIDATHNKYAATWDVYAFGVLLNEMVTKRPPWFNMEKKRFDPGPQVVVKVKEGDRPRPVAKGHVMGHLVTACWSRYSNKRPTMKEAAAKLKKIQESLELDAEFTEC